MGMGRLPAGLSMLLIADRSVGLRPGCASSALLMSATEAPDEVTCGDFISATAMRGPTALSACWIDWRLESVAPEPVSPPAVADPPLAFCALPALCARAPRLP